MPKAEIPEVLAGSDILSLITVGMYNNPLAIYREYIQNAADAVGTHKGIQDGKVEIELDPGDLRLRIRDNGPGLSYENALRALLPIARSEKRRGAERGFRGIGRLAGLAFAQRVTFVTRTQDDQKVTRIVWDRSMLDRSIAENPQTERAIRECITVERLSGTNWPTNFFEVEVSGVGRYAAGLLLNRDAVRAYIGEVCPVPIAASFPFVSDIENLFGENEPPFVLDVFLNGESLPVTRRFDNLIRFPDGREDQFTDFEKINIPAVDGKEWAALGWIAHSSYHGVVPKDAGIRGIRVRAGNIQVGDEAAFDHLFPEDRFNRWCVGELHIVDPRIVPNGRRDYFELGPHIRNLENHLGAVIRGVAARCRKASAMRNHKRKFLSLLCQMEETYDLGVSGYLAPEDARALVEEALNHVQNIRGNIDSTNGYGRTDLERLDAMESKLRNFRVRRGRLPFGRIPRSEVATYRRVFNAIAGLSRSPSDAKEMIETILRRA